MMSRVLVIEPVKNMDVSLAARFGELTYVFNDRRPSVWTPLFSRVLIERLKVLEYDPLSDHIVMSGSMMTLIVSAAVIGAEYKRFRALHFNSRIEIRDYESMIIGSYHHEDVPC
jgi:hypothetical protein